MPNINSDSVNITSTTKTIWVISTFSLKKEKQPTEYQIDEVSKIQSIQGASLLCLTSVTCSEIGGSTFI